jgi:hypothetical protein
MDINLGPPEATEICNVVTGADYAFAAGPPAAVPYFIWNGSNWALSSTAGAFRIAQIACSLS